MAQTEGTALQRGTYNHDEGADKDHPSPAQNVAKPHSHDGTTETTDGITGHGDTLDGRPVVDFAGGKARGVDNIDFWKGVDKGWKGEQTAHHTLVITEETVRG